MARVMEVNGKECQAEVEAKVVRGKCEGIDIVQADHAPQAGVAHPWRSHQAPGWTSGRAGRGTGGRSRETGEERPLKQPDTSAHAWMTWNDTQGET